MSLNDTYNNVIDIKNKIRLFFIFLYINNNIYFVSNNKNGRYV